MFAERIYDVTACYFPLSFVPPPNDPYGIKPEELSQSLEDALCGHASLLEFVVPFFIDKLSSTVVLAKVKFRLLEFEWGAVRLIDPSCVIVRLGSKIRSKGCIAAWRSTTWNTSRHTWRRWRESCT
jgi:hypothetical protein